MRQASWAARAAVVAILSALSSACNPFAEPKDLIVGKWEPVEQTPDENRTVEFTKDGKIHIRGKDSRDNAEGTYKFIDDNTIEATITEGNEKHTDKVQIVKITKQEMVTKSEHDQKEGKFKRVK